MNTTYHTAASGRPSATSAVPNNAALSIAGLGSGNTRRAPVIHDDAYEFAIAPADAEGQATGPVLAAMLNSAGGSQLRKYPGDYKESENWPGVAPGEFGPVNAISPKYNRSILQQLMQAQPKPPMLWIQGADDNIIADHSFSDPGYQGKLNLRDGWPGDEVYPPQPMVSQIEWALQKYKSTGGVVRKKCVDDCGHTPFIEKPDITARAVASQLQLSGFR